MLVLKNILKNNNISSRKRNCALDVDIVAVPIEATGCQCGVKKLMAETGHADE